MMTERARRRMRGWAPLLCTLLLGWQAQALAAAAEVPACIKPGTWMRMQDRHPTVANDVLLREVSRRRVVLLGEHHDNPDHHAWQLQVLAGLLALHPDLAIGFEMFPRSVQPALDRWVAGSIGEKEFLQETQWQTNWSFDPNLYLPLFRFARINRIPMYALNVDHALVGEVRSKGWAAVPADARGGIGDPAPASRAYLEMLANSFLAHRPGGGRVDAPQELPKEDQQAFQRFVEGQQLWDRAMAEGLAGVAKREHAPLVVGVMGTGHIAHNFGVPHQLKALGISDASVLIPWDDQIGCDDLVPGFADAVFGLDAGAAAASEGGKPRLGVYLEPAPGGVKVVKVVEHSVAEGSGLKEGDYIVELAGSKVADASEIITTVQNMALGTWLPLVVRRGEERIALVAKFPPKQ